MRYSNPNGDGAKPFLTKLAEEKPENALEYAAVYAGMGLPVVPNDGKKPLLKGWTKSYLAEEEVPLHFGDGQNVDWCSVSPQTDSWLPTSILRRRLRSPTGSCV